MIVGVIASTIASCDENSWNDKYLDGFKEPPVSSDVKTEAYTLTDADYASASKVLLSKASNAADSAAARAVASNLRFASEEQARLATPSLLSSNTFPYFALNPGSSIKVTYRVGGQLPEECNAINNGVKEITLSKTDYQTVWDSQLDYVEGFTPSHPAAEYLPDLIAAQVPSPEVGQYVYVNYQVAATDPVADPAATAAAASYISRTSALAGASRASTNPRFTSVLGSAESGQTISVVGAVTAICSRGFILADNTGSVLVYQASGFNTTDVALGDIVNINSATVGAYNKALQIAISSSNDYIVDGHMNDYTYPAPQVITAAEADATMTSEGNAQATYIEMVATPYMNGTYLNLRIEGAAVTGTFYQLPTDRADQIKVSLLDKPCNVRGYYTGTNVKSSLYNILLTEIIEMGDTELSSTIGSAQLNDEISITGIVTGICARGFIVTDRTGSILAYQASGFSPADVALLDVVNIPDVKVSAYNRGLQVAIAAGAYTKVGSISHYEYPMPVTMTATEMDATANNTDNALPLYIELEGTPYQDGSYLNFRVEGSTLKGSFYQLTDADKAAVMAALDKTCTIRGYYINTNKGIFNVFLTELVPPVVTVETAPACALYRWDGSAWTVAANTSLLQPADYEEMGMTDGTLSNSGEYLPIYLSRELPYAQEGAGRYVVYKISGGTIHCDYYTYTSGNWTADSGVYETTEQFVRNASGWVYDPSVKLTVAADKSAFSVEFYQTMVDWTFNNICVPMGDTDIKSGKFYVTKYGNNEYYSGASAYYTNVDIRAAKAREQYAEPFEGLSDKEISELLMKHLSEEVLPGALAILYPDMKPIAGVDVTFSVTLVIYTGSNTDVTFVYKVADTGKYEFISNDWPGIE